MATASLEGLTLHVGDLRGAHEQLREAGIDPNGPPRREGWGETDFMIRDPG